MTKKNSNLKVVQERNEEEKKKWSEESHRWKNAEKKLQIPARELRGRVRVLRAELQRYCEQLQAVPFDIASGDMSPPRCLDGDGRKYTLELVEDVDTKRKGLFEMIDNYAKEHGCHDNLDFNAKLVELKMGYAETAFQIGVLAGAMYAGGSDREIDRLERGLVDATVSREWRHKEVDRQ